MADLDPELQKILQRKAAAMKKEANFFSRVNRNGVTHVNDDNIERIIESSPIPVLVDFSADEWCRPCQVMLPIYEELSHEFADKLLFIKINTDHNPKSSGKYRIFSVPTFMIFKSGQIVAQRAGAAAKPKFKGWIEDVLERIK
jgi:thioredoxin 1